MNGIDAEIAETKEYWERRRNSFLRLASMAKSQGCPRVERDYRLQAEACLRHLERAEAKIRAAWGAVMGTVNAN